MLDEADYAWVTEQLLEIARRHAGGRVVSTLEGGYDLPALGASAAAHVRDADGGCLTRQPAVAIPQRCRGIRALRIGKRVDIRAFIVLS